MQRRHTGGKHWVDVEPVAPQTDPRKAVDERLKVGGHSGQVVVCRRVTSGLSL